MSTDLLQSPLTVRGLTLPNRAVIPPMGMLAANPDVPGVATDEHLVHYGVLAESGVGLIIVEATAVQACGPFSPTDLGLYNDEQIAPMKRIVDYIHKTPCKAAIQLAHAGRKGITLEPMNSKPIHLKATDKYGHQCVSSSAIPHHPTDMLTPHALTLEEIEQLKADWVSAAKRAVSCGFDAIEIHAAHGYLLNQFSSPIANKRTDQYGGSLENRLRLPLELVEMVRAAIPETMPLLVRISCVDWDEEGITIEDSVVYANELVKHGADLIHCSSGGVSYKQHIELTIGYQVKFAEEIKSRTGHRTIGVGNIRSYDQALEVLENGQADLVAVGRAVLADPMWYRNGLVSRGATPWVPPRQMMGFYKSQRRQAAEKAATEQVQSLQSPATIAPPAATPSVGAIRWPANMEPGSTDNFVHNEIIVPKLTASAVWKTLIDTSRWTSVYSNVADVIFRDGQGPELASNSRFSFKTFGLPIEAEIVEYVPPAPSQAARIAWHGWMENGDIDVIHAWLFEDIPGNRVRIVTEETQNGPQAKAMAVQKPNPMLNAHQEWIEGLAQGAASQ
eukprot:Blabericola_migrator_1__5578@NODE_283_length_10404_cov_699_850924_g233_i0_p2_GENE_NODE_283_length_10404_cov_699_850924_g233_i0NODE_283_length_10404_cov_699_850924_g233_i0_p2_ORF_typecomplete_len561_score112_85Oxidored_FMN/PF00724_20/2_6e102Dus/PF01207_17/8_5e08Polyketide_cyc2/PF10604_9/5_8e05IMPDH/PF00478_25/0_0014DHO_dh/PF01180_21/0_0038His_biosynth/PF00977_21/0_27His_biosynth/PF00977_21/1e03_NODE_283_length_10404_cov_699_850924_g233_i011202802